MRRLALGALVVAVVFTLAAPAAQARVQFDLKGRWTCKDGGTVKPLQGARIELWRSRDYWRDQKVTSRHTDGDGRYAIPVNAEDHFDLYVKVLLHDDDGVELENWYSPFTWETTTSTKRSRSGTVNLGTWQIGKDGSGTPKCAIWQGMHDAYADYRRVIGQRPPSRNLKIEGEFPCCGTPFTTRDTIRWPGGYTTDNGRVSKHEFAHTVRHTLDGNFVEFTADVARYQYPQTHEPCKDTNTGFAFNEGWAEWWADTARDCPPNTTNFSQEGNVAAQLKRLEACSSRPTMVTVLRNNPGRIHSYTAFLDRFNLLTGGAACTAPRPAPQATVEPVLSAQQQTGEMQRQISAQRKLVASLNRRAAAARRRARNPGRCTAKRCEAAMEKLIEPTALAAQAQQAKLVLNRLEDGLAAARKAGFDPAAQQKLADNLLDGEDSFEKANQKIVIAGLKKGLREIKTEPGFNRGERSKLFKALDNRADGLSRARRRGQETPASVRSLFAAPSSPIEQAEKVR